MPFDGTGRHLSDQIFHAPGAKLRALCTPHSISFTYPLCGPALTNTTDNHSEMCPLKLTDFCLFFTIDHPQSYKGRLFPQWLSQVVTNGAQTGYPQMGEPAL